MLCYPVSRKAQLNSKVVEFELHYVTTRVSLATFVSASVEKTYI